MLSTITPSAAIYTVAGATMTEPKAHMRIDSSNTADDAMVELYCTAAQRYIEARARIVFGVAEFRIETRAYQIPLEITKFKSLEAVATLDSAGAATTITTGYRRDLSQAVPHLIIDPAVHLEPYAFRVQYKAEEDTAVQTAKLQLRNINILYNDTGFFKLNVDVSPYSINVPDPDNVGSTKSITPRKSYNKTFSGFITNSSQIGEYKLLSGTFKSSILSNSYNCKVSLTNDEYLPCAFQSAEWEGFLHMRSRRI